LDENEIGYYNFENYSLISKFCRKSKKPGGSCIYEKTKLEAKPYHLFEDLNQEEHSEASIIEISQCSIIIICVYRTPNSNINIFIENMDTILSKLMNKGKGIIIVGVDYLGKRINLQLQTMLNSYGLQAIVDVPTRIQHKSQTAIDQIILNKDVWVYTPKVMDTGFSNRKVQILQVQFLYKSKKWKARLKGELFIGKRDLERGL
jgi:hypothetical protein